MVKSGMNGVGWNKNQSVIIDSEVVSKGCPFEFVCLKNEPREK